MRPVTVNAASAYRSRRGHQGKAIVPIPGTRKAHRLEENVAAADIALGASELAQIEAAVPRAAVVGASYPDTGLVMVNR